MSTRGKNPKSLANLKPAKKGDVRNPGGVNRKRPISDRYWEISEEPIPAGPIRRFNRRCGASLLRPGDSWGRAAALRAHYEAAMEGSTQAAKEIREAIEGKAPQRLQVSVPAKTQFTIRVLYDRKPRGAGLHDFAEPEPIASRLEPGKPPEPPGRPM